MRALCVLESMESTSLLQGDHQKSGHYRLMVAAHIAAGLQVDIVALGECGPEHVREFDRWGAATVEPASWLRLLLNRRLAMFVIRRPSVVWLRLIWRRRHALAGVDAAFRRQGRPDSVVVMTRRKEADCLAYLVSVLYGIPLVIWEKRSQYQQAKIKRAHAKVQKEILSQARRVLAVSPPLREAMEAFIGRAAPNMSILSNPISAEMFEAPSAERCTWVTDFSRGRFVFAGWTRWRDIKRLDIALSAFAAVHAEVKDSCMVIAGPVPAWAEERIADAQLREAVMLAGPLDREGIRSLAHSCDCCIIPSDFDTSPNAAIEAMAAGKPVIATRCGGPESIVTEPALGVLVEKGDAGAFARAMTAVLTQRRRFKADRIRRVCESRHSEQAFNNRWREIYKDLARSQGVR